MSIQSKLDDFVSIAEDEIGTRETGDNNTKYGEWYGMNGEPWCAIFVSWCANEAGILTTASSAECPSVPKKSYTPDIKNWYSKSRRLLDPKTDPSSNNYPKIGDVVLIDSGGGSSINHCGIVASVSGSTFKVIEGNCGDKVQKITYKNLKSSSGAKILYLCSNHISY